MTPEAVDWLRNQIASASDFPYTIQTLLDNGFNAIDVLDQLEKLRPKDNCLEQTVYGPPLSRSKHPSVFKLENKKADIFMMKDFLDADECAELIKASSSYFRPSNITYAMDDPQFRTSSTVDMCTMKEPIADEIDWKICKTLGYNPTFGESGQIQHYEPGQQFKAHWDPFDGPRYHDFCGVRGQRTWTCMVYLNDVEEGGHTCFTELDVAIKPSRGTAVFWDNLNRDGSINVNTKHAGLPVIKGTKVIITKWFRTMGHGAVYAK